MPFEGVAHRAWTTLHQARYVSAIYQRMQAAMNGSGMVGVRHEARQQQPEISIR